MSEPFSALEIEPIIYTLASQEQKVILREQYEVGPFQINTIRLERIFADKIFAAEFYYKRAMYFDVAKHIYDVSVMTELASIGELLKDPSNFQKMLNYKRLEETRRTGSDLADKKYADFKIFDGLAQNSELVEAFQNMQKNYVFSEKDILPFEYVTQRWQDLRTTLLNLEK